MVMSTGGKRETTAIVVVEDEDDEKNKETTRSDSKRRTKKRARRKGSKQHQQHLLDSAEFRALLSLLMLLVVFVLVEILLIDTIFMGQGGSMAKVGLSNADYFISDSGALEEGLYLANANNHDKRNEEAEARAKPNKESRYGDSAVVVGLETCQQYRNKLEEEDEPSVAVLGLFQRRSRLFAQILEKNCQLMTKGTNLLYKIQDNPSSATAGSSGFPSNVLPIVLTQDPYPWMMDICNDRPLELELSDKGRNTPCPKLLNEQDHPIGVTVRFQDNSDSTSTQRSLSFESLATLWNEWHQPPPPSSLRPVLWIRSEDLLLHTQDVVTRVCSCLGGRVHDPFRNKAHMDPVPSSLFEGYTLDLLQYAVRQLNTTLLDSLHYYGVSGHPQQPTKSSSSSWWQRIHRNP